MIFVQPVCVCMCLFYLVVIKVYDNNNGNTRNTKCIQTGSTYTYISNPFISMMMMMIIWWLVFFLDFFFFVSVKSSPFNQIIIYNNNNALQKKSINVNITYVCVFVECQQQHHCQIHQSNIWMTFVWWWLKAKKKWKYVISSSSFCMFCVTTTYRYSDYR